jgi:hypothetical protein
MNDKPVPGQSEPDPDTVPSADEPDITEYDKTVADSFPASDPPAQP